MIRQLFLLGSITFFCDSAALFAQKNNPPVVKIIAPLNESKVDPAGSVQFKIKVADAEDGDSEYGEIAANEIILEVRYIRDVAKASSSISKNNPGLASIKKSNCFTCHAFNGKLIAPSFHDISKKYPVNPANVVLLGNRIRKGSGGVWGNASMPSHEEIAEQQANEIATWILEQGQNPNLIFYSGTEGSFKVKQSALSPKGALILSATYSDHGIKDDLQQSLTGKDAIIVLIK